MLITIILLVLLGIPIFLYWLQKKWEDEDRKIGIIGPKTTPLIGNILDLRKVKEQKRYYRIIGYYDEFNVDSIRLRIGPRLLLFTKDVKILEAIANNPKFIKPNEYEYFKIWLGNSMVLTHGDRWYKLRKLSTPAFHFQMLEKFIPIFEDQADILIERLMNISEDDKAVDVTQIFQAFALDVVAESAMGIKLNTQTQPKSEFASATGEMLSLIHRRLINPLFAYEWFWRKTAHGKKQKEVVKYIHEYVNDIIEKRRDQLLAKPVTENKEDRPVLLDILLQSEMDGKPLSNEDITGEVNTFMFAGHETTGLTLSYAMYLLAKYPEAQKRLQKEINESKITENDEQWTNRNLNSLPYLDGVFKETLRLYTIFPMVPKKCIEDIRIGDIFIPANTFVGTTFSVNHLDEKYFKNAMAFIPERWTDEISVKERNPYVYQPFSAGLRNCIGQKFATLESKVAIIKIISKFEIFLEQEDFVPDIGMMFTIRSLNGMPLIFKQRH